MERNAMDWAIRAALLAGLTVMSGCVVYDVPPGPVAYTPPPARHHTPPPPEVVVVMSAQDRDVILDYFGTLHRRRDPVSRRVYEHGVYELPEAKRRYIRRGNPLPGGVMRESLPIALARQLSRLPAGYMWVRVGTDVMIVDARSGRVADLLPDGARIVVARNDNWSDDDARRWHDAHRGDRGGWSEQEQDRWHGDDRHDRRDDRRHERRDARLPDIYFDREDRHRIHEYFDDLGASLRRDERQRLARQYANPAPRLRNGIREGDRLPSGVNAVTLPNDLEARLVRLPRDVMRVRVGTDVVLLHRTTGIALDVYRDGAVLGLPRPHGQDRREERRDDRQDARQERRDDRQDARQDRRDDRQEAREDRRDDRRDARDDRQDARQDRRDDRQDARQDRRDDRQEARDDRREDRQEVRQDRRDDRQEAREDRRENRQEARQDRREDRREVRQQLKDDRPEARSRGGAAAAVVAFSAGDRDAISAFYGSRPQASGPLGRKRLPMAARLVLAKGKPLPRGARAVALPAELERQLGALPAGHRRVVVGADVVILNKAGVVADLIKGVAR